MNSFVNFKSAFLRVVSVICSFAVACGADPEKRGVDETKEVMFEGKIMPYADALPILTQVLDEPNLSRRIEAAKTLQRFGVKLVGTPALATLLSIVEAKEDFAIIEKKFKDMFANPSQKEPEFSKDEQVLLDRISLKTAALTAGVISGDAHAIEMMHAFLVTKSLVEPEMAREAKQWFDDGDGGAWLPGQKPPKTAEPRITYYGHGQVKLSEFKLIADKVLQEKDVKKAYWVFNSLANAASAILEGKNGAEALVKLLKQTDDPAFSQLELRNWRRTAMNNALLFIDNLPPDEQKPLRVFVEAAAKDSDATISENGAALLQSLK